MKKALITGISGQDGAYLAKILISKGYKVYGADRRSSERSSWRLAYLNIIDKVELIEFELSEYSQIASIIKTIQPDHFYNLAAMSFVGSSFNQPIYTHEVNSLGVCRILDAIHHFSRDTKFYQGFNFEKCLEEFKKFLNLRLHHFILEVLMEFQNFLLTGRQLIIWKVMIFCIQWNFF